MQKISTANRKMLDRTFPNIKDIFEAEWEKRPEYKIMTVSVFDHFLGESEIDTIYETDLTIVRQRREVIQKTIISMYENTDVYLKKIKRHDRLFYFAPNSLMHILKHCDIRNQHWWTGQRFDLILPEYSAIYSEDFDWGNAIFYLDDDKVKPLVKIIEDSGMFILKRGKK